MGQRTISIIQDNRRNKRIRRNQDDVISQRIRTRSSQKLTSLQLLSCIFLLINVLLNNIKHVQSRAIVTIVDYDLQQRSSYFGQVGNFGKTIPPNMYSRGHIMLPPDSSDPYLCNEITPQYIDSLKRQQEEGQKMYQDDEEQVGNNETNDKLYDFGSNNIFSPSSIVVKDVAVFVSRGNCTFEDKARNVIKLQPYTHHYLKYLIVYNNNQQEVHDIVVMNPSGTSEPFIYNKIENDLSMIFVSTVSGSDMLDTIYETENRTESSPYLSLLSPIPSTSSVVEDTNRYWDLQFIIEAIPDDDNDNDDPWGYGNTGPRPGTSSSSSGSSGMSTFYWLRFVLFAILIISPCLRAGYLWYLSGGRILIRRNDRGRIVGLQYVRPLPYWYTTNNGGHNGEDGRHSSTSSILTEEQVNALPVISYKAPIEGEDNVTANSTIHEDDEEMQQQTQHKHPNDDVNCGDNKAENEDEGEDDNDVKETMTNDYEPDIAVLPTSSFGSEKETDDDKQENQHQMPSSGDGNEIIRVKQQEDNEEHVGENSIAIDINDSSNTNTNDNEDKLSDNNNIGEYENNDHDDDDDDNNNGNNVSSASSEEELTTMCTSCSICIDEFEEGEELVLLPRCKHAFHLECIKPWLTERQGCCPLCKVSVLEQVGEEGEGREAETNNDAGNNAEMRQQPVARAVNEDAFNDFSYQEGGIGSGFQNNDDDDEIVDEDEQEEQGPESSTRTNTASNTTVD